MDTLFLLIAFGVIFAVFANLAATHGVDSREGFGFPDTRLFS